MKFKKADMAKVTIRKPSSTVMVLMLVFTLRVGKKVFDKVQKSIVSLCSQTSCAEVQFPSLRDYR